MTDTQKSEACPSGGSVEQVAGFFLVDTLSTQREMMYDRSGVSTVGPVQCSLSHKTSNFSPCIGKTPAHVLTLNAHSDRQSAKCNSK